MNMESFRNQEIDPSINLGVIGLGKHCIQAHLCHLPKKEVKVGAVYDPALKETSELAEILEGQTEIFDSEEALLASNSDAVLVMSPDEFHAASLLRAVRSGKHVFVEKPLAINDEQLTEVLSALRLAKAMGLVVSSCHPRRFDPPFIWVKDKIESLISELGAVNHFEFDFSYHRPSKDWKDRRGLLIDHISHEIDLTNWLFGITPFNSWKFSDNPSHYHVVGLRDDGIAFSFQGSRYLESKKYRESLRIRFDKGSLEVDANTGEATISNHERGTLTTISVPAINYETRFKRVNINFLDTIRGKCAPYLDELDLYVNTAIGVRLTNADSWRFDGNFPD